MYMQLEIGLMYAHCIREWEKKNSLLGEGNSLEEGLS
jgi:hypothetical protein